MSEPVRTRPQIKTNPMEGPRRPCIMRCGAIAPPWRLLCYECATPYTLKIREPGERWESDIVVEVPEIEIPVVEQEKPVSWLRQLWRSLFYRGN